MKVNIERLEEIKKELNKINSEKLEDIEFYKDGKKIEMSKELIDKWKYIGLNNVYYITTDFYLKGDQMKQRATEIEYLKWFRINADFGPADSDVKDIMNSEFMDETGKNIPEGWNYMSDGETSTDSEEVTK